MRALRVCLAGAWDPDFHRNRALRRFLDRAGCEVTVCRVSLWGKRRETIVHRGRLGLVLRALVAYPTLVWRFLRTPAPDLVIAPYPGHFDVPVLAPLCRLRKVPLVFDVFISLHDTIVSDRRLAEPGSIVARVTEAVDRLSCRLANRVLADTPAHARHFSRLYEVAPERFRVLPVGADEGTFRPRPEIIPNPDLVLFYGTFIPLHGMETIVRAAKELEPEGIRVRIIGDGQEREKVDRLEAELEPANLERMDFVPENRLPHEIAEASVCLGIFGTTGKADRVIPNKVYQCLAMGRPVVTGDTTAVREAFGEDELVTVPVGDVEALAGAVRSLCRDRERRERIGEAGRRRFIRDYGDAPLGRLLRSHLEELASRNLASDESLSPTGR